MLVSLAADSGQWSRQILQDVVDILTAMIDIRLDTLKGEAQDLFKAKHADLVSVFIYFYLFKILCYYITSRPNSLL